MCNKLYTTYDALCYYFLESVSFMHIFKWIEHEEEVYYLGLMVIIFKDLVISIIKQNAISKMWIF